MLKRKETPNSEPTNEEPDEGAAETRFEDILMMVFNGPMCFECLEEAEEEGQEAEPERDSNLES